MMTRSSPSSGGINIAASAQKLDVDQRIALRYYLRIADNILRQADIFREEGNIIDLYVMLLRFSSLVSETIPCHRDYRTSAQSNKIYLKKRLLTAIAELEELKPAVQRKLDELSRKHTQKISNWSKHQQDNSLQFSRDMPPVKKQNFNGYGAAKTAQHKSQVYNSQGLRTQQVSISNPVNERFQRLSLTLPRPKEETLTRHSIIGRNGLYGQWQPPSCDKIVRYPSNIDTTPVEIPRHIILQHSVEEVPRVKQEERITELDNSKSGPLGLPDEDNQIPEVDEPPSLISFETMDSLPQPEVIRQPSPPPVLADVQDLVANPAASLMDPDHGLENNSADGLVSEAPLHLYVSTTLMDSFMKLAKSNTNKNLETCGVLAGSLKNRKFYITALIIPKQESTSDSCQTTNEEEIFEVQDKRSLFPLGWIHTHPTQSCFMSSIDLHTHYSYQIMLPEAIAIVMAPRDSSRTHGIFRLTTPGGMGVIRQCPRRGFHPHDPPLDGSPIYSQCTDVYMDPGLKFDVIDLR